MLLHSKLRFLFVLSAIAGLAHPGAAAKTLPIREVTVFKDGHAFLLREGSMPTNAAGSVVMPELPAPELGTFFPYSDETDAPLTSVVASRDTVDSTKPASTMSEMLQANKGQSATITGTNGETLIGTIVDVRGSDSASFVLIKTSTGAQVFPLNNVRSVVFGDQYRGDIPQSEQRSQLTLSLGWKGQPRDTAKVGMMYLQKGLRWLPSYKITIDGAGNAHILLQATLLNELADLDDVTANLVIGVPTFDFAGTPDPISLQQTMGQLSSYFQRDSRTMNAYANSVATQVAGYGTLTAASAPQPEVGGGDRNEDLFVFTVHHVTLKQGQTMVLPVTQCDVKYTDLYTLDLPAIPPHDAVQYFDYNAQQDIRAATDKASVYHKIRIVNSAAVPLTTAPALLLKGDRVISQDTMTYTPVGASTDLTIASALNVRTTHKDVEAKNTPNAVNWNNQNYGRVDLIGSVDVDNCEDKPIDIEITRHVLGHVDSASEKAMFEALNSFDGDGYTVNSSYAAWWDHLNGYGKIVWKAHLTPKKLTHFTYTWHYHYR